LKPIKELVDSMAAEGSDINVDSTFFDNLQIVIDEIFADRLIPDFFSSQQYSDYVQKVSLGEGVKLTNSGTGGVQ